MKILRTAPALPEDRTEIEAHIAELTKQQNQESIFARITAEFNNVTDIQGVLQTLRRALYDLGYQYLSIWERRGERLYWHQGAIELPKWLTNALPNLAAQYIKKHNFNIWVPLDCACIYAQCYRQQLPQSTQDDREIITSLNLGDFAFADLPLWLQQAGFKLVERLDVQDHNAFPLGKYGIVFLSNPKKNESERHRAWVRVVLQQAEVAIARAQTLAELEASKARYQALFDRTNDAVFIIGLDLVLLAVNQQAADMLGYTTDEMIGMPAQQVMGLEDEKNTQERREILDSGEIPPLFQRTFIKKDGRQVFGEVSIAMVYDDQGIPSHYQSIVRDVSERVKMREQLYLQATALETAANGIMITDRDGVIQWVNRAILDLSGYSKSELVGQTPKLFNSSRQNPDFYKDLWETITNDRFWKGELINKRKDGSLYTEEMTITPVHGSGDGITHFIAIKEDVSPRVQAKKLLIHLATHDDLTNLANRSFLSQRLEHAIVQAKRTQQKLAVLFIDLDDFKPVNDSFGHEIGDFVLQIVAQRLTNSVRESDTAARLGGDEFAILLENIKQRDDVPLLVAKIFNALTEPYPISERIECHISASIGISLCPDDSQDAETLMKYADQAMYAIKSTGKKGFRFFTPRG